MIMGSSAATTIVWFRRDLRIEDNPALASACGDGCVLPVFIWCPEEEGQFYPGRCSRWWLKQSLAHLDESLRALGSPLVFLKSDSTFAALSRCVEATGATRVVYNRLYDPVLLIRDHKIRAQLGERGISVQSFNGDLLHEPWEVYDEGGLAYITFDPYWKKCMSFLIEPTLLAPPEKLVPPTDAEKIPSCSLEELCLENEKEKLSNALLARGWCPGWSSADKVLTEFVNGHLIDYSKHRNEVEGTTTSFLSPYLHFGEVSVRKVYQSIQMKQIQWAKEGNSEGEESVGLFLRSMGFREYSRYLCFNFPFTLHRSLAGNLSHYPWRADEGNFKCWRQGRTGYPLVDAGMRELWATGWIHNRIRVITASFLVKFLLLSWTWGLKYFWDTLLDADLECDILGWQYISGSLLDGHKLTRLDSPEVQGSRFDPDGNYVRTWLPELARMPTEWIHHPWDAPNSVLEAAGVELGMNYPRPIIDINTAKERLDDAAVIMWELYRTTQAAKLNGPDEVVEDNLLTVKALDIPKVVVKKEISMDTSSRDQRVPSVQNMIFSSCGKGLKRLDGENAKGFEAKDGKNNDRGTSKVDEEDLLSTAGSSSSRKRSFIESQYVVPSSSHMSNPFLRSPDSVGPPAAHLPPEVDGDGVNKEEEVDHRSSIEGVRPCKKPVSETSTI